ncbi:MAG: hypothetical protein QOF76_3290 [Solirubrobacteraceae bacterium]|nr:hypothetical protein [Solirubrobacteraceae bacterium]
MYLGSTGDRSVAATVYGLVDRGVALRPEMARRMHGTIRIVFAEAYAPVLLACTGETITVSDDASGTIVDLEVQSGLTDLVLLISAPLAGGVPKPTTRTGRAALARWVDGRVDFSGSLALARKLLALLSVAPERP